MEARVRDIEKVQIEHEVRIANLEAYQEKQNGCLSDVEKRLHSLERWIMMTLAATLTSVVTNLITRK